MPFTLSTITLEEQIAATQPTGRYRHTVEIILADEQSGWKNQPFKGDKTIHDYDVVQNEAELAELLKENQSLEKKRIPELQAELAKPAKEGGGRLATKNLLKDAYHQLALCMSHVSEIQLKLKKNTELQKIAVKELVALRYITNEYKNNKDREWLIKAVHLACEASTTSVVPLSNPVSEPVPTDW